MIKTTINRPMYFYLMIFCLFMNSLLGFALLYIDNDNLAYFVLTASIILYINIFHLNNTQKNAFFICMVITTTVCSVITIVLGWEYGFQNWLITFCFVSITVPFPDRKSFYILALIECIIYFILYFWIKLDLANKNLTFLNIFFALTNIIGLFGFIIFAERILKWSFTMEKAFLKDEIEKMKNMVYIDKLTGLYNRHKIDIIIANININIEKIKQFYVVFSDIDNFKKINDQYGHDAGDKVLTTVSNILKRELRQDDIAARFGGEEFLIVLNDMTKDKLNDEKAYNIIEKIRRKIESSYIVYQGNKIKVSMTFGMVSSRGYKDVRKMIKEADEKMYIGKRSGKNKVVFDSSMVKDDIENTGNSCEMKSRECNNIETDVNE